MGTDRHLIASSITARYRIEVAQNNANISSGTSVCHRCKFGVEHLFHVKFTNIGRSVHSNKRHEAKRKLQSQYHYTLINRSNLYYRGLESAGDGNGYSLEMVAIAAARPVIGVATYTGHAAARPPHLRESSHLNSQPPQFPRQ
jgi:hypothetical protein